MVIADRRRPQIYVFLVLLFFLLFIFVLFFILQPVIDFFCRIRSFHLFLQHHRYYWITPSIINQTTYLFHRLTVKYNIFNQN